MGVNFREIVSKTPVKLEDLSNKVVAIDAFNAIYQFLSIIRQPDGTPLKDNSGKVTSHLSGLFYRTSNLMEMGIRPVYVFDGTPPDLKTAEIERRRQVKVEAAVKYEKALAEGKTGEARMYAQATSSIKDYMEEDSKKLLTLMGLPWVQAPSEGEAQAAYMTRKGHADYTASQDYDSLLFGAPRLLRNVTISGRRKLPNKNLYIEILPEVTELNKVLQEHQITQEQLIDIGILVGTDFNPDGVKGFGPKTALKLIKEYKTIEAAIPHIKNAVFPVDPQKIREIFLHPKVTDNYTLNWKEPDVQGIIDFLCSQKDFSEDRVKHTLDRLQQSQSKQKGKTTLEKWFG
ncbi:MAG: flap endonuclease-1 [Candidatus Bathyarchaeota archaeon]|nr:flap endonuclease-1 [Candidatus Bathyarchaeota archaeon]